MLVLGRKTNEAIQIGDDVTVVVTKIGPGNRVAIGIVAPPHVSIVRVELLEDADGDAIDATEG